LPVPGGPIEAGVTEHFYTYAWGGIPEVAGPPHQYTWPNTSSLRYKEQYWNKPPPGRWTTNDPATQKQRGAISPALFTCKNDYNSLYNWGTVSHNWTGVNVVWYDGSGRWVSIQEVFRTGGTSLRTIRTNESLPKWLRERAEP